MGNKGQKINLLPTKKQYPFFAWCEKNKTLLLDTKLSHDAIAEMAEKELGFPISVANISNVRLNVLDVRLRAPAKASHVIINSLYEETVAKLQAENAALKKRIEALELDAGIGVRNTATLCSMAARLDRMQAEINMLRKTAESPNPFDGATPEEIKTYVGGKTGNPPQFGVRPIEVCT